MNDANLTLLSSDRVRQRLMSEFFDKPILENNLRGYWCEAMVAEALGKDCHVSSGGWAPWDLQIGKHSDLYPDRIRIQVKNSARLQTWHGPEAVGSQSSFNLVYRGCPAYWERDYSDRACEKSGFLCDVFALCFHSHTGRETIDQRDPAQWSVYLISAHPADGDITDAEFNGCKRRFDQTNRPRSLQRRPETLEIGIRGRRLVRPIPLQDLNIRAIRQVLENSLQQ